MNSSLHIADEKNFPKSFINFYRLNNYSATAYFYLDKPGSDMPPLAPVSEPYEK